MLQIFITYGNVIKLVVEVDKHSFAPVQSFYYNERRFIAIKFEDEPGIVDELNPFSELPLYQQLKERLKIDISRRDINTKIPSEVELVSKYNVSRITVRKAVQDLVEEGFLIKVQGRGTFTRKPKLGRNLREILSYSRTCQILGVKPGAKVLKVQLVKPSKHIRDSLHLRKNESAVILQRLRYADNTPVLFEKNYFPQRYNFLLNEDLDDKSLYSLLANKYHVIPTSSQKTIEMVYADEEIAQHLRVLRDDPILLVTDLVYDPAGSPIHHAYEYILGNKFRFIVSLPSSPINIESKTPNEFS